MKTSLILLLILGLSLVISKAYATDTQLGSKAVSFGRKVEGGPNGGGKIIIDSLDKDSEKKRVNPVTSHDTTASDDESIDNDDGDDSGVGVPRSSTDTTHRQINYEDFNKLFHHNPTPEP